MLLHVISCQDKITSCASKLQIYIKQNLDASEFQKLRVLECALKLHKAPENKICVCTKVLDIKLNLRIDQITELEYSSKL